MVAGMGMGAGAGVGAGAGAGAGASVGGEMRARGGRAADGGPCGVQ